MSEALDRHDRLAEYSGERGSMVLLTEPRKALGAMTWEVCNASHPGGIARGVVLDEPGGDTPWLLWMLATAGGSPIMGRSLPVRLINRILCCASCVSQTHSHRNLDELARTVCVAKKNKGPDTL